MLFIIAFIITDTILWHDLLYNPMFGLMHIYLNKVGNGRSIHCVVNISYGADSELCLHNAAEAFLIRQISLCKCITCIGDIVLNGFSPKS